MKENAAAPAGLHVAAAPGPVNVALRLAEMARRHGDRLAIASPANRRLISEGTPAEQIRAGFRRLTFAELDAQSSALALGLAEAGLRPGMKIVLLVRPGLEFFVCVFGLFKAGLVTVLIDPGMPRRHLLNCLAEAEPDGFVAIPLAQALRIFYRGRFPRARHNVTVGRRWLWGGPTYAQLIKRFLPRVAAGETVCLPTQARDAAAIIFTSGSTGPPKGVLYTHENFDRQVVEIQQAYGIGAGEIDLPAFPLFGLFNAAMGVSSIVPRMDFTRPAQVNAHEIVATANAWSITQSFGSPALWNAVGRYCEQRQVRFQTLRRVLSAGAPVPPHVLARLKRVLPAGSEIHTPYGATEALPVATISASEVLGETAAASAAGAGTCVGQKLPGIEWRVVPITDAPLENSDQAAPLPVGEIGELLVKGPVVTGQYVTRTQANALHKVRDGDEFWHRMGDVGYLDARGRFWFCGRKSHRVQTPAGVLFTIPCEAIFNQHPRVYRSALVGVGERPRQVPALVVETWPEHRPTSPDDERRLLEELKSLGAAHAGTRPIAHFFWHPALPVDIRHNAKIFREQLAVWAAQRLPT